jgi:selenocysteine lyase/cysteine desulfurase
VASSSWSRRQWDLPLSLDVRAVRRHFDFPATGRVVTNNAATTQPPCEPVDLYRSLVPGYENVHRGQSSASRRTTELFESFYDTMAAWVGPPDARDRSPLVAFNVAGKSPFEIAGGLEAGGVKSRAGCHCATLAHRDLGLTPPASCRLSFALYTDDEEVDRAVAAVRDVTRDVGSAAAPRSSRPDR